MNGGAWRIRAPVLAQAFGSVSPPSIFDGRLLMACSNISHCKVSFDMPKNTRQCPQAVPSFHTCARWLVYETNETFKPDLTRFAHLVSL